MYVEVVTAQQATNSDGPFLQAVIHIKHGDYARAAGAWRGVGRAGCGWRGAAPQERGTQTHPSTHFA